MLAASPLATICQVIQKVCATAAANASLFHNNEAATRAALIDPLLRALGWDTSDVRMVEPERTVANKQSLDYVLKDAAGHIRSVIEAKKLGESLDKIGHVGAAIGYAFSLKPKSFFITDGLNWHYYSPAHSNYQPVETLSLLDVDPIKTALGLIQWLDAAQSGYGIQAPDAAPTAVLRRASPLLAGASRPPAKSVAERLSKQKGPALSTPEFIDVAQLHLPSLQPGQKPKQLCLPNGAIESVLTWKDILLAVARLVLATNPNLPISFPDKAGKKRFLFSAAKPEIGSSTLTAYRGQPVFICTNYSAADCIANAVYAAQQLPTSQQTASLAVRF